MGLFNFWSIKIDYVSSKNTSFKWTFLHETTINRGTLTLIGDEFSKHESFAKIAPRVFEERLKIRLQI